MQRGEEECRYKKLFKDKFEKKLYRLNHKKDLIMLLFF